MRKTIPRHDAIRLIARARESVCDSATLQELLDNYGVTTVFDALGQAYAGVSNGFLSQVYAAISGTTVEIVGEPDNRLRCPCCNRQTLDERFDSEAGTGYDVCDHCGWEDDGTRDDHQHSSVNHGTMAEYRGRMVRESNYYFCDKWRA